MIPNIPMNKQPLKNQQVLCIIAIRIMSTLPIVSKPSKRKAEKMAGDRVEDIKSKLTKLGLAGFGNKSVQSDKLARAEQLVRMTNAKGVSDLWSCEEVRQFMAFLPGDAADWVPGDVKFSYEYFNTHACDSSSHDECSKFIKDIYLYMRERFSAIPRVKSKTVRADVLVPMMTKLARKKPAVWKQKEIDLLVTHFSDVNLIDGAGSDPAAVAQYYSFVGQLQEFYILRPDLKALIDPDVVVFDILGADKATYTAALAAYVASARFGVVPEKWNPCALGTVFPMASQGDAYYMIGSMTAAVPNLRAILIPGVPGAALAF